MNSLERKIEIFTKLNESFKKDIQNQYLLKSCSFDFCEEEKSSSIRRFDDIVYEWNEQDIYHFFIRVPANEEIDSQYIYNFIVKEIIKQLEHQVLFSISKKSKNVGKFNPSVGCVRLLDTIQSQDPLKRNFSYIVDHETMSYFRLITTGFNDVHMYGKEMITVNHPEVKDKIFFSFLPAYEIVIDIDSIELLSIRGNIRFSAKIGYRLFKNAYKNMDDLLFCEIKNEKEKE